MENVGNGENDVICMKEVEMERSAEIKRNWVGNDCVECKWRECEDIDVDFCFEDENKYGEWD